MNKGLKRFFIICAAVTAAGIVTAAAGFAAGGMRSVSQLDERFGWLNITSGDTVQVMLGEDETFSRIEVNGNADIRISTGKSGSSSITYDDDMDKPSLYVSGGTLYAGTAEPEDEDELNISAGNNVPEIELFIPEGSEPEKILIEGDYGDISIDGIKAGAFSVSRDCGDIDIRDSEFSGLDAEVDFGNITAEGIESGRSDLETETGDVRISGMLRGLTEADSDTGDISIVTGLEEKEYSLDLETEIGNLELDGKEQGRKLKLLYGDRPCSITASADIGDIKIDFGR